MNTEGRFVLAIVLMVAVLVVTNVAFPPVPPPETAAADSAGALADPRPSGALGAAGTRPEGPSIGLVADSAALATTVQPERLVVVEGPLYRHRFSTRGARLVSAELLEFVSFTREGPVQLVGDTAAGVFGLRLVAGGETIDLRDLPFTPSAERLTVGPDQPQQLTFRHESQGLSVEVVYRFQADAYLVEVTGSVQGAERAALVTDLGSGLALNDADDEAEARALGYAYNDLRQGITSRTLAKAEEPAADEGPYLWAALKSKFFLIAVMPGAQGVGAEQFGGLFIGTDSSRVTVAVSENLGADGTFGHRVLVGPMEHERLTALGADLDEINPYPYGFGWLRPLIRPLVALITGILVFMHERLNLAHGWVLVLFGVMMRVLLWPLNQKAMRAQMKQMAIQPLFKEIQTKYKDDQEKLQKEMLKLYKEHGFNPMAGCLPMLFPMPILISLFFVFQNTIEFRGASFFWLPDLSAPDPYFILPVFLGVSMFLLQWISLRSMPDPNPQMKMMMWMMPPMMTFIFFRFAAGLNLYYAVSNLATIPQQYFIAKERQKMQPPVLTPPPPAAAPPKAPSPKSKSRPK